MDSTTEPTWRDGVYLAVGRDRAKTLFAAKTTEALNRFFDDCCADAELVASDGFVSCQGAWPELKQHLESLASAADEETRPLLEWAARGTRPVGQDGQSFVVRPDMVPLIAEALKSPASSGNADVDALRVRVRQVYEAASAERAAVAMLYRDDA